MRNLTVNELEEVNGGFLNFIVGGLVGAGMYALYGCMTGAELSLAGFAGATVAGSVTMGFSALAGGGATAGVYFGAVGTAAGAATHNAVSLGQGIMD